MKHVFKSCWFSRIGLPALLAVALQGCGGGSSTPTFTVTVSTGTGGSASATSITVAQGSSTSFTLTAESGYSIESADGCGGSLAGSTYTTGAISASCTVTVTFMADPTGYYVPGNLSVDGATDNGGLQALVHNNRIMMMSVANGLLYDGTLTITQNTFTANFTIYTEGANPIPATASGTINPESWISGTLTGAGIGEGTFSLTYATSNNEVADLARLVKSDWSSPVGGSTTNFQIMINDAGAAGPASRVFSGVFNTCDFEAEFLTISGTNMYGVNFFGLAMCDDPLVDNNNYYGIATTRSQTNVDDRLVLMFVHPDNTFAFYGEFE